jgi:iron(III) transport system permease protein
MLITTWPPHLVRGPMRLRASTILYMAVLCLLGFVVLYPITLLLVNSLNVAGPLDPPRYSLDAWRRALAAPGIQESVLNTVKVVGIVQAITFPLAILLAWLMARTDLPGRTWLEFGFWIGFFLPPLGITLGWILVLDPHAGIFNSGLARLPFVDIPVFNIFSMWGIIWVHIWSITLVLKVMLLTPIFRNMDSSLEEAARLAGARPLTGVRDVVVPLMWPALLVLLLLGTVSGMNAFEVEQALGVPANFFVYSTKMFGFIKASPPEYANATVLGVLVLGALIPFLVLQQIVTRKRYTTVSGRMKTGAIRLRGWKWPAFALVLVVLGFVTVLPTGFLFMAGFMSLFGFFDLPEVWTTRHWTTVLSDSTFATAVRNTLVVSTCTALIAVGLYSVIAYVIVRSTFFARRAISFLSWLPFPVPGIVLGLGFLWFTFSIPVLKPLYGSVWLLIIVNVITTMTLGIQIFESALANLSKELEEASRVAGASWWRTFRLVVVPVLMPTMIVVGIIAFVFSARQIATVAMLIVGNNHVLATLQLSYMMGGDLEKAAVVGTITGLLSLGLAVLARIIGGQVGIRPG